MTKKNLRIARQLVRIARSLVAAGEELRTDGENFLRDFLVPFTRKVVMPLMHEQGVFPGREKVLDSEVESRRVVLHFWKLGVDMNAIPERILYWVKSDVFEANMHLDEAEDVDDLETSYGEMNADKDAIQSAIREELEGTRFADVSFDFGTDGKMQMTIEEFYEYDRSAGRPVKEAVKAYSSELALGDSVGVDALREWIESEVKKSGIKLA